MKIINKTFSYRLKPTQAQKECFAQAAGCARYVYNFGLGQIKTAMDRKEKIPSYEDIANQLPALKKQETTLWLKEVPSQVLQQSLIDLKRALNSFFRRVKKKEKPGFPRFKSKGVNDSFRLPQGIKCLNGKVFLPKIGWVAYRDSRPIEGTLKQAVIKHHQDHWFVHIVCSIELSIPAKHISLDKVVGIDVGIKHLAVLSTGHIIENPHFLKKELSILARRQKAHARKKRGSKNRKKSAAKLGKLHARIKNKRNDYLHKESTKIVESQDIIIVESLSISGMIQNRKLSQAIADVGWRIFLMFIKYKAEWQGKIYIEIDRFAPTSKICSSCKSKQEMPLSVRIYKCKSCSLEIDRDLNAALNIRAAGIAVLACREMSISSLGEAGISGF